MATRTVDQEHYRFGFNGQERDDDLSGTGNINTALFWEYDARLGRRWNMDPKGKDNKSYYSAYSGNPIIMIDPYGDDDDVFDSDGKYMSTIKSSTRNIYINNGKKNIILSDVKFTSKNAHGLANIAKYYAPNAGVDVGALKNSTFSVASIDSDGMNTGGQLLTKHNSLYNEGAVSMDIFGQIGDYGNFNSLNKTISIGLQDGNLPSLLSNIDNLTSFLFHEGRHQHYQSDPNSEYSKKPYWAHIQVYYDQVKSPLWEHTTGEFKAKMTDNISELLNTKVSSKLSPTQQDNINNKLKTWKEKFTKAGVKLE